MTVDGTNRSMGTRMFFRLFLILLLLMVTVIIGITLTMNIPLHGYEDMKHASSRMYRVFSILHERRMESGVPYSAAEDPRHSGMIGLEFSPITTTLGSLEAKQIAVNPEFAALFVKWMKSCDVTTGDIVAIHASSSFPALIFAAIIACETMNTEPIIAVSLGSSSYGANIPGFSYLEMEKLLLDSGVIHHTSGLITPGGTNDNGSSLWEGAEDIFKRSAESVGKLMYTPETLLESIQAKKSYFYSKGEVALFINIGGNHAGLGHGECALDLPSGLITKPVHCSNGSSGEGLIHRFNHSAIPIIHMLNIRELAVRNGLIAHPQDENDLGNFRFYYSRKKPVWIYAASLVIILVAGLIHKRKNMGIFRVSSLPSAVQSPPAADDNQFFPPDQPSGSSQR